MVPAALPPALALIAGAAFGIAAPTGWRFLLWPLPLLAVAAAFAWRRSSTRLTTILIVIAFGYAGGVLGVRSREAAMDSPLRLQLDREIGGFAIETVDVPGVQDPIQTRALLIEDAASTDTVTTLRVKVRAIHVHDTWMPVDGGAVLSVGGLISPVRADAWRRGRLIEAPVTFRRPARYLDDGVADFERQTALEGISLLGSIKSGLLIALVQRGTIVTEAAAEVRAYVRRRVGRWVGPHSMLSAAIVAAVLIGDRTGLPDDIRLRLQAAGTYHVIAISGGNIAILAAALLLALSLTGTAGRPAALVTLVVLIAYSHVVSAGPSVWRATLVAGVYLVARLLDHRSAPWQAIAISAGILVSTQPLDIRNAGFILTFGATGALLEVARRLSVSGAARGLVRWTIASMAASAAVEIALLPVMAFAFSRVTAAGVFLNLVAVPLMAVVQIAGLVVACAARFDLVAAVAGWIAHLAAAGIVQSARLVDVAPWLTARVPVPSAAIIVTYYAGLAVILIGTTKDTKNTKLMTFVPSWLTFSTAVRGLGVVGVLVAAAAIITGFNPAASWSGADKTDRLRLTVLDVGQGDAMVLEIPGSVGRSFTGRQTLMVDTGGSPFGSGGLDIGVRVVEPALWARGVRTLQSILLTHGDPDHIGGATALIDDFHPTTVWQGIPVGHAAALQAVLTRARDGGIRVGELRAGEALSAGTARVRVLHPPPPDWERQRVRNDDSIVLEVLYGDVALLLTGDVGSDVERDIAPRLIQAKTRILKVAHHGSRTSTSHALLDAWRPQIALISCGRGNPFGHPAPEVIDRLTAIGAAIYRTDRDGEITIDTDGRGVRVRTFVGGKR